MATRRRPGARLNRERILLAAQHVIDREGLPALNMRRLATELEAAPMSLYRYFESKSSLLDGVVELTLHDLATPLGRRDWKEASEVLFWSLRGALCAHPNALPLVASRPFSTRLGQQYARDLLEVFRQAGFDAKEALHLLSTLTAFTVGHVWILVGGFVGEMPDEQAFVEAAVPSGPVGATESTSSFRARAREAEDAFASGLRMILDRPTVAFPPQG